jgi:mono/diheme cytochrome c family protein
MPATKAQKQRAVKKITFVLLIGGAAMGVLHLVTQQRDWIIPPEAATLRNPMANSVAALGPARAIYRENCAQCHGETGRGDGREAKSHSTLPPDFSEPGRIEKQSDGVLFYKISDGKRPMPSFRSKLTDEQRWQLVTLVRELARASRKR